VADACECGNEHWVHKMWGISRPAEERLASEEGFCSMGLISYDAM
jgi:hypothetical protein